MQQYRRSVFADRFAEVAADSNHSRFAALRDITSEDIRAAAEALWEHLGRTGQNREAYTKDQLDADSVNYMLLAKVRRYADEDELVSVEYQEYWDATDAMKFTFNTLDIMRKELARRFLAAKREEGFLVVDNAYGIWLFKVTV